MAGASGDIIRITDKQSYLGQTVLNVYFYQINDTTLLFGDYLGFIGGLFKSTVVDKVAVNQTSVLEHIDLFLENLTNGVDIKTYVTDFPVSGNEVLVAPMPPFVSYGYQMIREERTTRNGYKRFAGVDEASVTNGVYTGLGSVVTDIEDALGADLESGIVNVCNPVIVRHPITIPLVSPVLSHVGSALFKGVGSQNTRKFNRGI